MKQEYLDKHFVTTTANFVLPSTIVCIVPTFACFYADKKNNYKNTSKLHLPQWAHAFAATVILQYGV